MSDDNQVDASPAPELDVAPRATRMTQKEQRIGFAVAALALVGIAGPWIAKAISSDRKSVWLAALSTALAVILAYAVRRGHRVVATFAAVLAGFPPPRVAGAVIAQLACLVYGGWLMLVTNRAMREANKTAGRNPADRARARQQAKAARRAARQPTPPPSTIRRATTASKRYTPPQAKKRR